MVDYTKCKGEGCEAKYGCFRFRAKADEFRQSFFMQAPGNDETCDYFMSLEGWPKEMLTPVFDWEDLSLTVEEQ